MLSEAHPNELEHLINQGNDYLKQKQLQQALLYFNKVALLSSKHIDALTACAEILIYLHRPEEAAIYSQHAFKLQPNCRILTLHGQALYQMGKYADALNCFEHIIAERPNNYIAMGQSALCLTQLNRHDEALHIYQQALTLNPKDALIRFNYSLCLLAMGNLLKGFTFFEYRKLSPLLEKRRPWMLPVAASVDILKGKSILIYSEQGLGDSIQFFRYMPLLVEHGANVFLEMQPSLIPLFHSWHSTIRFIARGCTLPVSDYHCPMMSLATLFKTDFQTIPKSIPYVMPKMHKLKACQKKLNTSNKKRIGIAWNGNVANSLNQKRSIPLKTLLTIHQPNIDFICLQKDISLEEKNKIDQYQIAYHGLELNTLVGTAALMACLDLIITIDTSIAHLAGSMNKKVWILLPFSADWRWFLKRKDSPWYPSATLFRQEADGDWQIPLLDIKNALIDFTKSTEDLIHA